MKFKCVSKTVRSDLNTRTTHGKDTKDGGVFVVFEFSIIEPLDGGIKVANVYGPAIVNKESDVLRTFSIMITDPSDFNKYEQGSVYTLS